MSDVNIPPSPESVDVGVTPAGADVAPTLGNDAAEAAAARASVSRKMTRDTRGADTPPPRTEPTRAEQLIEAHARQGFGLQSVINSHTLKERFSPTDETPLDTETLIQQLDRDQMWGNEESFLEVRTQGQYAAMLRQIQQEKADRQLIDDATLMENLGAGVAAGAGDPLSWLPLTRAVQLVGRGSGAINVIAQSAAVGALSQAVQEPFLQASQELRTAKESAVAIGGSAIVGGLFGVGAVGLAHGAQGLQRIANAFQRMGEPEWNERLFEATARAWNDINEQIATNPQGRRIAGGGRAPSVAQVAQRQQAFDAMEAAFDRLETWRDLGISQTGPLEWSRTAVAKVMGKLSPGFLDPIDFMMKRSSSVAAREAFERIVELPLMQRKNLAGEATEIAAQTELGTWVGKWSEWRNAMYGGNMREAAAVGASRVGVADIGNSYYVTARRNGFNGGFEDFDRAVYRAIVRGHADPNPGVMAAAQHARELTEGLREFAIASGYQVPQTPRFAFGYVPRNYNIGNITGPDGRGTRFRQRLRQSVFQEMLANAAATNPNVTPQQLAAIRRRSGQVTADIYRNIVGDNLQEGVERMAVTRAGDMLEGRVVPLSDLEMLTEGWIDGRVTDVLNYHIRRTVPMLSFAARFKDAAGAPDPMMRGVFQRIQQEYDQLIPTVTNTVERDRLKKEFDQTVSVLTKIRDHTLGGTSMSSRTGEGLLTKMDGLMSGIKLYQYMRLMGGMVMSQLPDTASIMIRHGLSKPLTALGQQFADAVRPLVSALPKTNDTRAEAVRIGAAVEWATNASMAAQADLLSPFQTGTPFLRAMHHMGRAFSIANFSVTWNETLRTVTTRAAMDRILEGAERGWASLSQAEQRYLANLGVDARGLNRIGAAWRGQNDLHDGFLRAAMVSEWQDQGAIRLMENALLKDNSNAVVKPQITDMGTHFSHPVAGILIQFQRFMFSHALRVLSAAEQRVISNGAFSGDAMRVYAGMMTFVGMGMMSSYMYALARDFAQGQKESVGNAMGKPVAPAPEQGHVDKLTSNMGQWIANGIERSAITGLFGHYNTYWERLGAPGMTRALQGAFDDPSLQNITKGRWFDRDPLQTLLGPTLAQGADVLKFGSHVAKSFTEEDYKFRKSDARTIREAFPGQNLFYGRGIFDAAQEGLIGDYMGIAYDD